MTDLPNGEVPDGSPFLDNFSEYDENRSADDGIEHTGDAVLADEPVEGTEPDIEDGLPAEQNEPRFYTSDRAEISDNAEPRAVDVAALAVDRTVEIVNELDPELADNETTRKLVEMGAVSGYEVTEKYGTPDSPKVASGTFEKNVVMTYHNGGDDGHTSAGEQGAGVPRNVLRIARAVNEAAGREVYPADDRATAFYAAEQHDKIQLCGRSLLPEGQGGLDSGDERLSAEEARQQLLDAGVSEEKAAEAYDLVLSTAWNPQTNTQNVRREDVPLDPRDPQGLRVILGRELLTCADLLSPSTERGVLGTVEYAVERLCLVQNGQVMQQRLREMDIDPAAIGNMEQLMEVISDDPALTQAFTEVLSGDPAFYADYLRYEDAAIKTVTGGKGIDELFPGQRLLNASTLAQHVMRLEAGTPPVAVWRRARRDAGY